MKKSENSVVSQLPHQHQQQRKTSSNLLSARNSRGVSESGGGRTREQSPAGGRLMAPVDTSGASSNPGSPKASRHLLLGKNRDSSPASNSGVAGKSASTSLGTVGPTTWFDDMRSGSGAEGYDEMDGAGSGGAKDSRSSGGGSVDWSASLVDGASSVDIERLRLVNKIEHVKEKLVAANKTQEADVNDFLRLTSNVPTPGDNPQMIRIRQVFEKKNKKSAQTIMTLQKKLDAYQQKLRDLEQGASSKRLKSDNVLTNVGQGLKDVGANIKESLTGYTGGVFDNIKEGLSGLSSASQNAAGTVISVPKDIASRFLKKSDSADNIHNQHLSRGDAAGSANIAGRISEPSTGKQNGENEVQSSTPEPPYVKTGAHASRSGGPSAIFYTDFDQERTRTASDTGAGASPPSTSRSVAGAQPYSRGETPPPHPVHVSGSTRTFQNQNRDWAKRSVDMSAAKYELQQAQFETLLSEMHALRRSHEQVSESLNEIKSNVQQEYAYIHAAVHAVTFRVQRVEDQLNDQAELHSAEINGLRGDLATVEGRVAYQMSQIDGDLKDVIGRLTTRVEALENRVKDQFGVDHNAVGNLSIRAGYLLAQTFLTLVFLLTQGLLPFMKTRARIITTIVLIIMTVLLFRNFHVFQELIMDLLLSNNETSKKIAVMDGSTSQSRS